MTIQKGQRIPQATFHVMTDKGPVPKSSEEIFKGKKVVMVGVPGAFTPVCQNTHIPGFLDKRDEILAKGVDSIVVTSVNDPYVMGAWQKAIKCDGQIEFLADGNADFAKAAGFAYDGSQNGFGTRSRRYAMLVDDGLVKVVNVEEKTVDAHASSAENILAAL